MVDFLMISTRSSKRGVIEVYPKFIIKKSNDLMIRGTDFYAIWIEDKKLWSTEEQDALQLIDDELDKFAEENRGKIEADIRILHMWDAESGMIDSWHKYCQKQMRDSFHMLDEKIIFSNTKVGKRDYASKQLNYPLEPGDICGYDMLMSTLYSEEERHKIEWAIGSVVSGDSKKIQKFMVLYGAAGTGKSTVLNIIQQLFDGYYSVFDAKALGSSSNAFALESFKSNPLVAIQHDGDLSRIEDNTRLNSLVSHEMMTVNEKFKGAYANHFKCFLFMGTNKPVKITDAKSGLIRRLIDVTPSGNKLSPREYKDAVKQVDFELGAIAAHCYDVFAEDPAYYDDYVPTNMLGASNDFYNFVMDSRYVFERDDSVTLKAAWEMYKTWCEETRVNYPFAQRAFKEELKNYFKDYKERYTTDDGSRTRNYYEGFLDDKFDELIQSDKKEEPQKSSLVFGSTKSIFDSACSTSPAQYATSTETPSAKWDNVTTTLADIDTSKLHYVKVPDNHIVIDFDIPSKDGGKSLDLNLEAASKWPKTYGELSKSGSGVHLHYVYSGDVSKLSRVYDDHIEIKVFTGKASLRRKLSKCNECQIATINSGLPLKGEAVINSESVKSEKAIRTLIKRNINKEYHAGTKPSIDFIKKILDDAYTGDVPYDVTDMYNDILAFAIGSTNQSSYCIRLVDQMKFKSEEPSTPEKSDADLLTFFDVECFPNLFMVCWKYAGEGKHVVRMINPTAAQVEPLLRQSLVGFNCRRYDNHMLYARFIGYSTEQMYELSYKIIHDDPTCLFGEAYNLSYTDIYDFMADKKSLKKLEIEMGMHHLELGLPWDKPVPEKLWDKVGDYCEWDVIATEKAFDYLRADFLARKILVDMAIMAGASGSTVNDTTNTLTGRIIFGTDKKPQGQFNYRNMGEIPSDGVSSVVLTSDLEYFNNVPGDKFTVFDTSGRPVFPGYKYSYGVSTYRDEKIGEGGEVYAEPGMHGNVALLDVISMHPNSLINEKLFGDKYTKRFEELVAARICVKQKDFEKVKTMLNGVLARYLDSGDDGIADTLAFALKIAINSVYGLTSAGFANLFKDPRNVDNIVAKRGALFMVNLRHAVQDRGFQVAHVKTDSIKIPNATPEIISFVMDYGRQYGYNFDHEATYDKMCLVNNAVYIAKYASVDKCQALYGYTPKDNKKHPMEWTATGTQFAVPYIFKKLFSREPIEFDDYCIIMSTSSAFYLDLNEHFENFGTVEAEYNKLCAMRDRLIESESADSLAGRRAPKTDKLLQKFDAAGGYLKLAEVEAELDGLHSYRFVGKVGQFCPVKSGRGGGLLLREAKDPKTGDLKYAAATGTKGYRWLESEFVRLADGVDAIDRSFFDRLVDEASESISQYCDVEWFMSEDQYSEATDEKLPFDI